jgi:STE24 endopeptidase
LYSTFEIEKKHGFNKQTLGLFFMDKLKGLVLTALFGGPFVALLEDYLCGWGRILFVCVGVYVYVFSDYDDFGAGGDYAFV